MSHFGGSGLPDQQALEFALVAPGLTSMTQAEVFSLQPAVDGSTEPAAAPVEQASKRVMPPPSVEEIAEQVYRIFCQELRRERERRGHWR